MALELIGALVLGIVAAGLAMLVVRLSKGRVSRAFVPVSAGLAMLGYSVWSDYSWVERTQAALPQSFTVLSSYSERSMLRPWTYLFPVTERFSLLNTSQIGRNSAYPDIALVDVVLVTRRMPVGRVAQFVDCAQDRRAQITRPEALDAGSPDLRWVALPADDPLLEATCSRLDRAPDAG